MLQLEITNDFKKKIVDAMLMDFQNYGLSQAQYSKMIGINNAVFTQLKKQRLEGQLVNHKWVDLARRYGVNQRKSNWKIAKTSVYDEIEKSLQFCKNNTKSMMLADDCGIGKSYVAKHIIKNMENAFYFDCSQAKTYRELVRGLAKLLGLDPTGKIADLKANTKYMLNTMLDKPLICLDEVGDLEYKAFLEIKSYWNGTEGQCAWFMMGAQGFKAKINKGINNEKVGYAEIFSRFSDSFIKIVPFGVSNKQKFYAQLIGDIAYANLPKEKQGRIDWIIKKAIAKNATMRYVESLIDIVLDEQ